MTLAEFNILPIEEKHNHVFGNKDVRLITFREYYNQKVTLWDCGTFFAEMYYFPEENKILRIEGFGQDDKRIDAYINFMNKAKGT
jgi:hypothetical protein